VFRVKKRQFFSPFFGENILKIITSAPANHFKLFAFADMVNEESEMKELTSNRVLHKKANIEVRVIARGQFLTTWFAPRDEHCP
jgi:hypothetical protein